MFFPPCVLLATSINQCIAPVFTCNHLVSAASLSSQVLYPLLVAVCTLLIVHNPLQGTQPVGALCPLEDTDGVEAAYTISEATSWGSVYLVLRQIALW